MYCNRKRNAVMAVSGCPLESDGAGTFFQGYILEKCLYLVTKERKG